MFVLLATNNVIVTDKNYDSFKSSVTLRLFPLVLPICLKIAIFYDVKQLEVDWESKVRRLAKKTSE